MRKIIPYGKQDISNEDIEKVINVLKSDYLTQGPVIVEFEKAFASFVGAKYAVSCSNATTALHISVQTLKNSNKKVLTTPITFAASANCVLYNNLSVDFVDIDPNTFLIDIDKLEKKIEESPDLYQGIIAVTLAGYPLNLEKINRIAKKYNLWVIEDACHSPGAYLNDENNKSIKSGSCLYNNISVFSFHPVKHIACGEGGMITTNDENTYNFLLKLRSHGITRDLEFFEYKSDGGWYHEMQELGYNYRITEIQAALGLSQLQRIQKNLERRNQIADFYDEQLKGLPIVTPFRSKNVFHAFHLYVIQTDKRKELYDYLRYRGVLCQVHYIPVYKHPYYQRNGFSNVSCPVAENYYKRALSLPMFPTITSEELSKTVELIKEFFLEQTN